MITDKSNVYPIVLDLAPHRSVGRLHLSRIRISQYARATRRTACTGTYLRPHYYGVEGFSTRFVNYCTSPTIVHRQSFHFDTEDTGPAYTQVQIQPARGPLDPLTTAVLDQPPGRAAKRLAPPVHLKRDLNKAHLHLGDLLPDPLRVAHLRRSCELLRVVYEERLTGKVFISHEDTTPRRFAAAGIRRGAAGSAPQTHASFDRRTSLARGSPRLATQLGTRGT